MQDSQKRLSKYDAQLEQIQRQMSGKRLSFTRADSIQLDKERRDSSLINFDVNKAI